jgi:prepilin peptidase CpaA
MMQTLILVVGAGLFAGVSYADLRTRRIPNEFIVGILALAALRMALIKDPNAALYTLVANAALFVATFLLFWRGLLGGGDVKLIGATGLLIGYHDVFAFLFVMTVSGALIAVAMVAYDKLGPRRTTTIASEDEEPPARLTVPYGVAIAVAAMVTLLVQFLPPG